MSRKTTKVIHGILFACAVLCTVVGFLYIAVAVATKLINESLNIFNDASDDDSDIFDDERTVVEPVIVETED